LVALAAVRVAQVPEAQLRGPAALPEDPELQALSPSLPVLAQVLVLASLQVVVGLAHLVVDSALLLDLLSRQSYSAAMARSSP
jgi:hypothetical protein